MSSEVRHFGAVTAAIDASEKVVTLSWAPRFEHTPTKLPEPMRYRCVSWALMELDQLFKQGYTLSCARDIDEALSELEEVESFGGSVYIVS